MKGFFLTVSLKWKSRIFIFVLFILLGSNFSCIETNSQGSLLKSIITENGKLLDSNFSGYVLLIPNDGCHPCIQKAIKLAQKNLSHKYIYFIVTSDFDFKSTKLKFLPKELLANNLVFDTHKKSNQSGLNRSFLIVFYFMDGQMILEKAIYPDKASSDLIELQNQLNKKME